MARVFLLGCTDSILVRESREDILSALEKHMDETTVFVTLTRYTYKNQPSWDRQITISIDKVIFIINED